MEVPILDGHVNVLMPLFVLKQNDDRLKIGALGLIAELVLIPDVSLSELIKNCDFR